MSAAAAIPWYEANQGHLIAALGEVRLAIEKLLPGESTCGESAHHVARGEWPLQAPPALDSLCSAFELSTFERKILLLCTGAEMDSSFVALYAAAHKKERRTLPTFSLALAAFEDAHWSALSPARPLRRWHLIEVASGEALTTSPLRISERVLHYLAGVPCLDQRLEASVKRPHQTGPLVASHRAVAEQIAALWSRAEPGDGPPIIELCGSELESKRSIAIAAASLMGLQLHIAAARDIPATSSEFDTWLRLWERETVLNPGALLLESDDADGVDAFPANTTTVMESLRGALMVSTRLPRRCAYRPVVFIDVKRPTQHEQAEIWHNALGPSSVCVNGEVDSLVSQFHLNSSTIRSAAGQVLAGTPSTSASGLIEQLRDACRTHVRPRLEGLAERIETKTEWSDLVLPESQKQILHQVAIHVRQRVKVYGAWGFASKGSRGLGISALFAGTSGTGKTMASEVLANELGLDLFRIDLSQVVSKYIGETEKNLGRVFDAAEEGEGVLLFDEADALFGKRTEVKDSHDRYANIEVSYLLQRMEAYRGLAILTTNRKSALDQAFLRRIRFVVDFPFPDPVQRAEIWRHVFPRQTPTEGLRIERLARLNAAGGNIRNIAIHAAFLAADAGQPVRMNHLLSATRSEFAKIERPLTDSEVSGWV